MSLTVVELDGAAIANWDDFHAASRCAFGFPDFYGNNLSAWIDCLSGLRDDDGMSRFVLGPHDSLLIRLTHASALQQRAAPIMRGLQTGVAEVNERCREAGEPALLQLQLA
jgi:hypothetical protein